MGVFSSPGKIGVWAEKRVDETRHTHAASNKLPSTNFIIVEPKPNEKVRGSSGARACTENGNASPPFRVL